jgi:multiple antibiotic resistance protein
MLASFIKTFFAIFGVMDPVGNVPMFLALTDKMDRLAARSLARRAVVRAGVILVVFVFLGNALLDAFHVSIESFRIAGGLILVLLGLQILFGLEAPHRPGEEAQDPSVVPLATPLIAGPGTITSSVILSKEFGYLATLLGIIANLLLSYLLFHYAHVILKLLGKKGTVVFAKVMGLILVSIGVEFIRSAL